MANVTFSVIRSLVRSYLDESSPSDWNETELTYFIGQRYQRVYTAAVTVFEDYNITTSFLTTVANQQEYTLPTDLFKLRRVEINYDISNANSTFQKATPLTSLDAVRTRLAETNIGSSILRNPIYYVTGTALGFLPIPDKAGTSAIKLWYVPVVANPVYLTDDQTVPSIPYVDRYWHLIAEGATADALRMGQQDSREADKFDQKFLAGILLMQEELEDRIADDAKFVIDTDPINFEYGF